MSTSLGQHRNTPKFTAEHSLRATRGSYRSASAAVANGASCRVVPQLGRGFGGGFGVSDMCDDCATFNFVRCQMDCGDDAECRHGCLIKSLECGLCGVDGFAFGGSVMM